MPAQSGRHDIQAYAGRGGITLNHHKFGFIVAYDEKCIWVHTRFSGFRRRDSGIDVVGIREAVPVGTDAALGGYCHHFDSFWPGVEYMVDRAYEKGRRRQSF